MNLWNFFGKKPKELFLELTPIGSHWRVVTWNFDLASPQERQWTVEIQGTKSSMISWRKNTKDEIFFFEKEKLITKRKMNAHDEDLKSLMNLSLHSTIKYSLEKNREFMLSPVSGATTLDFQNEAKALQWIQVSFGTLKLALEGMKKDKDLILTGAFFSGIVPESGEEVLRVIAFNLDIFYYLRPDQSLQIVVFNDKDLGHGKSKTPTFQQIIKVTKPQFYDEITKLMLELAIAGEIS
jgi:hypothetical protein